jgi:hypothetical protein
MSAFRGKADIAKKPTANGPQDLKRDAIAVWRRFVACVSALPENEAAPL